MKTDADFKLIQKNRKAYFNYEILEDLECGMALVGTEVKSVRASPSRTAMSRSRTDSLSS